MKSKKIIIGSRASKLALIYAEKAKKEILMYCSDFGITDIEIKKITTSGDLNKKDRYLKLVEKVYFLNKLKMNC